MRGRSGSFRRRIVLASLAVSAGCASGSLPDTGGLPGGGSQGTEHPSGIQDGLYTLQQAEWGSESFAYTCAGCHGEHDVLGPALLSNWSGRPLSELFLLVRDEMPENDPGVLGDEETAEIVAYILRAQGLPSGETPLPTEVAALEELVIAAPP